MPDGWFLFRSEIPTPSQFPGLGTYLAPFFIDAGSLVLHPIIYCPSGLSSRIFFIFYLPFRGFML